MLLSKSFAYAIRGILYLSMIRHENRKVQIEEMAEKLAIPRHFLGKIMQDLARHNLLKSTKGPYGGFELSPSTLSLPLIEIFQLTDDPEQMNQCELRFYQCDPRNPCPLHKDIQKVRVELVKILTETTLNDLVNGQKKLKLKNIAGLDM